MLFQTFYMPNLEKIKRNLLILKWHIITDKKTLPEKNSITCLRGRNTSDKRCSGVH